MGRPKKTDQIDKEYILGRIEKIMGRARWSEVTMSEVAKKVGIKPPSLYYYFDGLAGLKKELSVRALKDFAVWLSASQKELPKHQKLKSFFYAYREYSRQFPLKFECAQFGVSSKDKELMVLSYEIVKIALQATDLLDASSSLQIHKIRIIRSMLNGFLQLEAEGGFQINKDIDVTFDMMIEASKKILA